VPVTEQYHAFATNLEYWQTLQCPEELPSEYGSCRGIEAGYRQTGEVRSRTTGTDPYVRMFLLHLSACVYSRRAVERAGDGLWCTEEFTLPVMACALAHAATDTCNRGFSGPPPAGGCL